MAREPVIAVSDPDKKSQIRELVDWIGETCYIRAVRCVTAARRWQEYGLPLNFDGTPHTQWNDYREEPYWHRLPKAEAPTTYAVYLDGRCVNSFLTRSAAKRWALARGA